MSLLQRYRKPGGLKELIKLIETSSAKAKANILEAIEKEDPDFAEQVLRSLFYFEDILYQKDTVLAELFHEVTPKIWAHAIYPFSEDERAGILKFANHTVMGAIKEELEIIGEDVKDSVINSSRKKIVGEARKLEDLGKITLVKDPSKRANKANVESEHGKLNDDGTVQLAPLEEEKQVEEAPESKTEAKVPKVFLSIEIDSINLTEKLRSDFFAFKDKFILCKKRGDFFGQKDIDRLKKLKVVYLFIPFEDFEEYYHLPK